MRCMDDTAQVIDLADRHSQELDVVLWWRTLTGQFWVEVTHRRSGRRARIEATPANALDVFHHPFAYAGRRVTVSRTRTARAA